MSAIRDEDGVERRGRLHPEEAQGSGDVAGTVAQRRRDVGRTGQTQQTDGEVTQGRHQVSAGARADLRAIFVECDVTDPVELVLDTPVAAVEFEPALLRSLGRGETGDAEGDLRPQRGSVELGGAAFDAKGLAQVRKIPVVVDLGGRPDEPLFDAPVPLIDGVVRARGKKPPARGARFRRAMWVDCP